MGKNFLKPKFRIRRTFLRKEDGKLYEEGYLVEVRYWWFPIWVTANISIVEDGRLMTSFAAFSDVRSAEDYINRRYVIYTYDDMPKIIGKHGQKGGKD